MLTCLPLYCWLHWLLLLQVLTTDHVVLNGKFKSLQLVLHGCVLKTAPQQLQVGNRGSWAATAAAGAAEQQLWATAAAEAGAAEQSTYNCVASLCAIASLRRKRMTGRPSAATACQLPLVAGAALCVHHACHATALLSSCIQAH
jgi:hypothetical protein